MRVALNVDREWYVCGITNDICSTAGFLKTKTDFWEHSDRKGKIQMAFSNMSIRVLDNILYIVYTHTDARYIFGFTIFKIGLELIEFM